MQKKKIYEVGGSLSHNILRLFGRDRLILVLESSVFDVSPPITIGRMTIFFLSHLLRSDGKHRKLVTLVLEPTGPLIWS